MLLLQQLPVVSVPSCSSSSPAAFHDACLLAIIGTPSETIAPLRFLGKLQGGRGGRRRWRRYRRRKRWGGLWWEKIVRVVTVLREARLLLRKTAVAARKNRLLLQLRRLLLPPRAGRGPGILLQVRRLPGAAWFPGSARRRLGGVVARQRVAAVNGSPRGLAQTRQLLEALAVSGGGGCAVSVLRRGRGRQAENRRNWVSALLAARLLFVGDVVLMDSSRAPMPHPLDRLVSLWLLLCRAELRHPCIAIVPSRI